MNLKNDWLIKIEIPEKKDVGILAKYKVSTALYQIGNLK